MHVRTQVRYFVASMCLAAALSTEAQVHRIPVGTGATPVALAGDYRALGWNPAGLTFHPLFPDLKGTASGLEGGFSVESNVQEMGAGQDCLHGIGRDGSLPTASESTGSC